MAVGPRTDLAVRGLLGQISEAVTAAAAAPAPAKERVLLTTTLDGVRYTLMHCPAEHVPVDHCELSAREFEVARMVAHGYTNKTIAAVLDISTWTVDTYLRRIFTKLDVRTRSAMVTKLTREGILDAHDRTPDWAQAWREATDGARRDGDARRPARAERLRREAGGA